MKPQKRAEQKNIEVNYYYYNTEEIERLREKKYTFCVNDVLSSLLHEKSNYEEDNYLRVDLGYVKDLKVILDDSNHYTNAAVMEDGEVIYVKL